MAGVDSGRAKTAIQIRRRYEGRKPGLGDDGKSQTGFWKQGRGEMHGWLFASGACDLAKRAVLGVTPPFFSNSSARGLKD